MLADLKLPAILNYKAIAKKHGVVYTTLIRQYIRKTVPNQDAITEYKQVLNASQESLLLGHIECLLTHGIPSTSAIVKNFAEKIYECQLGKCWTMQFFHHHEIHLKTIYLKNIHILQKKSEYIPYFKLFYELLYK